MPYRAVIALISDEIEICAETKIVIDEAVNIAKDFDTDDSYKFINAVLDKIGKDEPKRA